MAKKLVKFYVGSLENYTQGWLEGKYKDGVFFDEQTHTIWKDNEQYSSVVDENALKQFIA
jgi:hypothetical protein